MTCTEEERCGARGEGVGERGGDGDGDDASLHKRFKHKSVFSCKLNLNP